MCKVIEVNFKKSSAALILEEYTKEELEWIKGIKERAEFWSDAENNKIESEFWRSLFND